MLNDAYQVTSKLHGPTVGWQQDMTLSEIAAFAMFLRCVGPSGGTFHTDCHNLTLQWAQGQAMCRTNYAECRDETEAGSGCMPK